MEKLTKQEYKIYKVIFENPGITTKEIMLKTGIQCPSGRITGLRKKGIQIDIIGEVKFPDSHAFKQYAIGTPLTKPKYEYCFNPYTGNMEERKIEVPL